MLPRFEVVARMRRALTIKAILAVGLPVLAIAIGLTMPTPYSRYVVIMAGLIAGPVIGMNFDRSLARWAFNRAARSTYNPPRL